jgi:hypothetical protein
MKKLTVLAVFIVACSYFGFPQDANFTQSKAQDGTIILTCPSDDDALILLNEYELPDHFYLVALLKNISFERVEFFDSVLYKLNGTKIGRAKEYGYKTDFMLVNKNYFNIKKDTSYYVFFNVQKSVIAGITVYPANIMGITDMNKNPIY